MALIRKYIAGQGWTTVLYESSGGLPSQWTDGGHGDVTAATDQDLTVPLTVDSSELGDFNDVFVLLPGDPDRLNGDGFVFRMESEGTNASTLELTGYATLLVQGPHAGLFAGTAAGVGNLMFVAAEGKIGFFGVSGGAGASQQNHIADPSGGGTQDAEARTAIASILNALEAYGLLKTS